MLAATTAVKANAAPSSWVPLPMHANMILHERRAQSRSVELHLCVSQVKSSFICVSAVPVSSVDMKTCPGSPARRRDFFYRGCRGGGGPCLCGETKLGRFPNVAAFY